MQVVDRQQGIEPQMDWWTKALVAWESGRYSLAANALDCLLVEAPSNIQARHLLGVVKVELGDFDGAIRQLQIVCAAEPANGDALSVLGNAQRLAGKLAEAEATFQSGLVHSPDNPHLHFNLGIVLGRLKRPQEAERAFLRASELDPADQESWIQLGMLRFSRSDHMKAASAFLRAADLDGERKTHAIRMAGFALADAGHPERAGQLLASLCPERLQDANDFHLLAQLLYCRMELCDWRQLEEMVARCKQFIAEDAMPLEPFTFLLLPGITAAEQLALTATFARSVASGRLPPSHVVPDLNPTRRLRIGYLSTDFHDHAVMRLLTGVLEHHNHAAFEIHAFSYGGGDQGEMRRRIVSACDHFHDVTDLSSEALAARIRAEAIDILVDLTGWTGSSRSAVLGFRPAPIQVNWLGYSGTLGSRDLADYLIGDPIATPLSDQGNFAEALVLMPYCCQPNDASRRIGSPRTRKDEGLPETALVFCCFSRPLKITPEIFHCWCDLLMELPESVLWLLATGDATKANLSAAAERRGINACRLVFSPPLPPEDHLARLALADLALDTFPFGAHTTASDALWAGLPVVTLIGETFSSRVTASMLNAIGMNELVTRSLSEYCARALELGRNTRLLASIRNKLGINRRSSHLFDTKGFAVALELLLRDIWQRHCSAMGATLPLEVPNKSAE